jgi:UDP-N-acetyl-D-mannosaminuronic acid dehydrogenase
MEVYVFGLGHIGLPLACLIALSNKHVTGIDINQEAVKNIVNGTVNIEEYYNGVHISNLTKYLIKEDRLCISSKFERTNKTPAIFAISVGIGNKCDGSQDISTITSVLDMIIPELVPEDLLIFRTTLIPGTCENFILPRLKALDFPVHLAYCPETLIETRAFKEFQTNAMILATTDDTSYDIAEKFLHSLSPAPIYRASNIRTAEMAKVVQNIHRDVNIALANEVADAATSLEIDAYELQRLVNTHPRVKLLTHGAGVGGYCLPNAYGYLNEAMDNTEESPLTLIRTARNLNSKRPTKVVQLIEKALSDIGKTLKGSKIAVIGLSMKDYCADCRFSPALDIVSLLQERGAIVEAYDPLVSYQYEFQVNSYEQCINNADCVVITAIQKGIQLNPKELKNSMSAPAIVVDTKNIFVPSPDIKLYKI